MCVKVTYVIEDVACIIAAFISFVFIVFGGSSESAVKEENINRLSDLTFIRQTMDLAAACKSIPQGSVRFWSLTTGEERGIVQLNKDEVADSMTVRSDGRLVAVTFHNVFKYRHEGKFIGCFSIAENKWLWKEKWAEKALYCKVNFTSDNRKLIAVGYENLIVYNATSGKTLRRQTELFDDYVASYDSPIRSALSPNGRFIAIWQETSKARAESWWRRNGSKWVTIWDIDKNKMIGRWESHRAGACSAAFTPDEKYVIFASSDGYVRVWSISTLQMTMEWRAYRSNDPDSNKVNGAIVVSPDSNYIATFGGSKTSSSIKVWAYPNGNLLQEFDEIAKTVALTVDGCAIYPMAFSPDGKYFAFEKQGRLCLYDMQMWKEKWCVLSWPELLETKKAMGYWAKIKVNSIEPSVIRSVKNKLKELGFITKFENKEMRKGVLTSSYIQYLDKEKKASISVLVDLSNFLEISISNFERGKEPALKARIDEIGDSLYQELLKSVGKDQVYIENEETSRPLFY